MKCTLKKIILLLLLIITTSIILLNLRRSSLSLTDGKEKNGLRHQSASAFFSTFDEASYIGQTRLDDGEDPYRRHKYNQFLSDKLPSNRKIPDTRPSQCRHKSYNEFDLPKTSIIITFHNEARSALLRTIRSVIDRTPSTLLTEIILVDDFSSNKNDDLLLRSIPKVVLVRNQKREGLVRSRMRGASLATSSVLTFLDSHCEANVGWIEPLLQKVRNDPLAIATPVIDVIKSQTIEYKASSNFLKGGFDWKMHFTWQPLLPKEVTELKRDPTKAIRTPVIAGGLFTITKQFFNQLGQYDPLLEIWGGENFEISFKSWMCGGSLVILPCSRVGHIFRKIHPYEFPLGNGHTYMTNVRRVAEVWMDKYKRIFYRARGGNSKEVLPRLEERREIRDRLKCRPFDWYLMIVYPELRVPNNNELAYGTIKQRYKKNSFCIERSENNFELRAVKCASSSSADTEQMKQWKMLTNGMIQNNNNDENNKDEDEMCFYMSKRKKRLTMTLCQYTDLNQHWKLMIRDRIRHQSTNLCIERKSDGTLHGARCDNGPNQIWSFQMKFLF